MYQYAAYLDAFTHLCVRVHRQGCVRVRVHKFQKSCVRFQTKKLLSYLEVKESNKVRFSQLFTPLIASFFLPFFERIMNANERCVQGRNAFAFKIFKILAIAFAFKTRTRTQNACVRARTRPSMLCGYTYIYSGFV
jgi:hypothetical protein